MNNVENLNAYKDAYETNFKFFDENQWYLSQYAKLMSNTINKKSISKILSLGIGHQVVSNQIIDLMNQGVISQYEIVEGSQDIIVNFLEQERNKGVKVHEAYFENFEPKNTFDGIEMGFVLEHVDDPLLILKRYRKFLNSNGSLFVAVPNARSLHRLIGHHAGLLPDMYVLSKQDYELGHKRYFDLQRISDAITEAGYEIVAKHGLMLKPITGDQMKTLDWQQPIIQALMEIGNDYPEISNCIYIEARPA